LDIPTGLLTWSQTAAELTVQAGITATDSEIYNLSGAIALPVVANADYGYTNVEVEYRAWDTSLVANPVLVQTTADLEQIPGELSADNPLKWASMLALTNSGNVGFYVIPTLPSDLDSWQAALDASMGIDDIRSVAPLSYSPEVLSLVQANVEAASGPITQMWRAGWFALPSFPTVPVIGQGSDIVGHTEPTTTDGAMAMGTVSDDVTTAGVAYTQLDATSGNVQFVTEGVRPGDVVRILYTLDDNNNEVYQTFVVDEVINETRLILSSGFSAPQSVATRFQVWRNLTQTEEANKIGDLAASYGSRRIVAVYSGRPDIGGARHGGYFMSAALAVYASSVVPHRSLTRAEIRGFSAVPDVTRFTQEQKRVMAAKGVWLVDRARDGSIYTKDAVTTSTTDINHRYESVTRNLDDISYRFRDFFAPFVGVTNVTESNRIRLQMGVDNILSLLQTQRFTAGLGAQLISGELVSFEISSVFRDRYIVRVSLVVPYALNGLDIYLAI